MKGRARLDGDLSALGALGALVALRFAPDWLRGQSPFWGDLSYIHQPWRSFDAELLMAGRLPLWNPFLYFGMPEAATMQGGLYYPGTTPYFLLSFASATAFFEVFHYWLAGAFAYLWLRAARLRRGTALGGAVLWALGGLLLSREPFLNHLAVLSVSPALILFFRRPAALALALTLAFFGGYPPFMVGATVCAWALAAASMPREALERRRFWRAGAQAWVFAGLAACALSAVLLVPALELAARSRRSAGVELAEALKYGFYPRDLLQWVSPLLVGSFQPAVEWWKCCYLGFLGCFCAMSGFVCLPRRRAAALAAAIGAVFLLILGGANSVSSWLWAHVPPLRFIRYPGNMAYLAALPLSALAAGGLQRVRYRSWLVMALCAELTLTALQAMPRAPRALLSSAGPLVRRLQGELGGHRYLLSPRALEVHGGRDPFDWRHRLYGLTNAPFKLRAAGNFGEPLVPRANYELMDALLSAPGAAAAAAFFPWTDVTALLTPEPVSALGLAPVEGALWAESRFAQAAGGWLLSPEDGAALPTVIAAPNVRRSALAVARPREDALSARGDGEGWAFLSETLYPGWNAWLETPLGPGIVRALPALGPFQKFPVPAGPWTLHLRYDPPTFRWGLATTIITAWLFGAYWYNRARDAHES